LVCLKDATKVHLFCEYTLYYITFLLQVAGRRRFFFLVEMEWMAAEDEEE
jgi:hypothetical protein